MRLQKDRKPHPMVCLFSSIKMEDFKSKRLLSYAPSFSMRLQKAHTRDNSCLLPMRLKSSSRFFNKAPLFLKAHK